MSNEGPNDMLSKGWYPENNLTNYIFIGAIITIIELVRETNY